jgi:alpha-glucosidase
METPWWKTAVVYQIYPRSFQDTNGDGIGDLPGITRRLDYLSDVLGVDALWISPFYPSPMADFGYDVSNYRDVHPMFGTLADFDDLLAGCHERGMRVIIDWVPNHTSDQHPWFVAARSSRDDPKRDWYVWRDARPDGSLPNNWMAHFGGPAWTLDETTGQYYLHSFLPQQPDLNWRNPEVEAAMLDTLRFWLERGVDGFRIDVAHFVMKDPDLRDQPLSLAAVGKEKPEGYDDLQHLHDKGHPDAHGVFRKIRAVLDSYEGDRFSIGEIHEFDWAKWASYYGEGLDELHMPFNFSLVTAPWDAAEFRSRVDALEGALPGGAWPNHVIGNHDEPRPAGRWGGDAAPVAAVLLLTLRGTPTIYYGDELAMPQVEVPPERRQDPWGLRVPGKGRDGCRTPMQWAPGPGAGFTEPGVEPWLPLSADADVRNVDVQVGDPGSPLNLHRDLLRLRRSEPALRTGGYRAIDTVSSDVFAYVRADAGTAFLVAANFGGDTASVPCTGGRIVLSTRRGRRDEEVAHRVDLGPHEAVVVRLG